MDLQGKKVLVFGAGISGIGSCGLLVISVMGARLNSAAGFRRSLPDVKLAVIKEPVLVRNFARNVYGHRECHILPDWLLIYRYDDDVLVLTLTRTGSHSDLFNL